MILIDIFRYYVWYNNPKNISMVEDMENHAVYQNHFLGYNDMLLDLKRWRGITQLFAPIKITLRHFALAKTGGCHFWMGKKWCYCKADIFEKLMDENNCPMGDNYDIDKFAPGMMTEFSISGSAPQTVDKLTIQYDE